MVAIHYFGKHKLFLSAVSVVTPVATDGDSTGDLFENQANFNKISKYECDFLNVCVFLSLCIYVFLFLFVYMYSCLFFA